MKTFAPRRMWRSYVDKVKRYVLALPIVVAILVTAPNAAYGYMPMEAEAPDDDLVPSWANSIGCLFGAPNIGFLSGATPQLRNISGWILGALVIIGAVWFLFALFKLIMARRNTDAAAESLDQMKRIGVGVILGLSIGPTLMIVSIVVYALSGIIDCTV